LNCLLHRVQNAGSRDGVFFFSCLKTQRQWHQRNSLLNPFAGRTFLGGTWWW
jgi:hypothetical protein